MTWLVGEWLHVGKPKFLRLLTGAVGGLATITPAAGYVLPQSAAFFGIAAGLVCYYAVLLKNKWGGTTRWTSGACMEWAVLSASSVIERMAADPNYEPVNLPKVPNIEHAPQIPHFEREGG